MDAKTLTALKASIEHWEENVAATKFDTNLVSPSGCALCSLFFWHGDQCFGCPVAEAAGRTQCNGTPYEEVADIWEQWDCSEEYDVVPENWRTAAQAELDFLKSLLPGEEEADG